MSKTAVLTLVCLLSVGSAALPVGMAQDIQAAPPVSMVPVLSTHHGPIVIEGDAGFAGPQSGVRGGSGTADDPYLISDWTIPTGPTPSIHLSGTRAFVVVRNITLAGAPPGDWSITGCLPECGSWRGLVLEDVQHVRVEVLRARDVGRAVEVRASSDVSLSGVRIDPALAKVWNGVTILESSRVSVAGLHTRFVDIPYYVGRSHNVTLEGVDAAGPGNYHYVVESEDVVLRDSRFQRIGGVLWESRGVSVLRTTFADDADVMTMRWDADISLERALFCGNTFRNGGGWFGALQVRDARGVSVVGNRFIDNTLAASLVADGLTFENNVVQGSTRSALTLGASSRAHGNSFLQNAGGSYMGPGSNATHNWWGAASGPSGIGPGTGDALVGDPSVPFAPWALSAPDVEVDCDALAPPVAPPEVGYAETRAFAGHKAAAVHLPAVPAGARVRLEVEHFVQGRGSESVFEFYGKQDGTWSWWGSFYVSTGGLTSVSAGIEGRPGLAFETTETNGTWMSALTCYGAHCPEAIMLLDGFDAEVSSSTFRLKTQGAEVVPTWTFGDAGFLTARDFARERTHVEADLLGLGATHIQESRVVLPIAHRLFGSSHYRGGGPTGVHEFTLEGVGPADDLRFMDEAPGERAFTLTRTEALGTGRLGVVWADMPFETGPASPSGAR
jgi:hypothetical protein